MGSTGEALTQEHAMTTATTTADPNLLRPFVLSGPAVERDRRVKDKNDSFRPDEEVWFEKALAQDAEISASEVEFFANLRRRMEDSK
jgi:hypothetical protein